MSNRFLFCAFLFFGFGLYAQNFDSTILRSIHVNRNTNLDPTFEHITNSYAMVSVGAPLALYTAGLLNKDKQLQKEAISIAESLAGAVFITISLKKTIKRDRPFVDHPEIQRLTSAGGYSFPSGHTSIVFATATSLSLTYSKWYVIAPSFIWASSVGYSRMHLGVHYPTDVIAGALIGSGSAYLTYKINKWIDKKKNKEVL